MPRRYDLLPIFLVIPLRRACHLSFWAFRVGRFAAQYVGRAQCAVPRRRDELYLGSDHDSRGWTAPKPRFALRRISITKPSRIFGGHLGDRPGGRSVFFMEPTGVPTEKLRKFQRLLRVRLPAVAEYLVGNAQRADAMASARLGHGGEAVGFICIRTSRSAHRPCCIGPPIAKLNYMCADCHSTDLPEELDDPKDR